MVITPHCFTLSHNVPNTLHVVLVVDYVCMNSIAYCSYNGGRTADDIIQFINGKANTRAGQKKAPSHVVELDEINFDSVVLDTTKDVLVEFYAPCKSHGKYGVATCQLTSVWPS